MKDWFVRLAKMPVRFWLQVAVVILSIIPIAYICMRMSSSPEYPLALTFVFLVIGTGLKTIEVDTFEKVNEDFTIYFCGSEEEWNDVEVADRGNDILETCKMVFDYKD